MARPAKRSREKKHAARRLDRLERRRIARRLRQALSERPLEIVEMQAVLQVDEPLILAGLRRLNKKPGLRLHSGVLEGRNCWWWEGHCPAAE
jgi:hypothetical protein